MIPTPDVAVPWLGSLLWLLGLTLASFLVTWVCTDRLGMGRTAYIAVLALVTGALGAGYVAWSGLDLGALLTTHWALGLVAAPFAGAFLIAGIRRLPGGHRLRGRQLALALLWEGVVYGVAEGLLLSTLPVLMTWQMLDDLSWSGPAGATARWTLPIVASIAVVVVHHLGYWEYRNRLLGPISVGCGLLSVGYLVTGSPIAPTLAHVLSHMSSLQHGGELPPHAHGTEPASFGRTAPAVHHHVAGRS